MDNALPPIAQIFATMKAGNDARRSVWSSGAWQAGRHGAPERTRDRFRPAGRPWLRWSWGGKSPVIVGPDANLKQAADWITFGKFLNAGQNCISPDHMYVHGSVRDAFLPLLRARIARAHGQGEASPHLARIISPAHADPLPALRAARHAPDRPA